MASIFSKVPTARAVTIYDQIGPEIVHLQKGSTARHGADAASKKGAWIATFAICLLLGLFFMDPFLFALHKSTAIRAYVYLHNYDTDSAASALAASHIFTDREIELLNERQGSFQHYFSSPSEAEESAASTIAFMKASHSLRYGDYESLDPIEQLRYILFVRIGLYPPMVWSGLNPSVSND